MDTSVGHIWRLHGAAADDNPFIFIAHRRPDSFSWEVPSDDSDLLAGKGALGTEVAKADDTFEYLLLMMMDIVDV